MIRRIKNATVNDQEAAPGIWMTTFSDLVMLMVTFFVMILAMSSLSEKALKKAFTFTGSKTEAVESVDALEKKLKRAGFAGSTGGAGITVKKDERGIVLSLGEDVLFETGKTELKAESVDILDSIARVAASSTNDILIMGHTDNTASNGGEYDSNLELSAYRSLSVFNYFVEKKQLPDSRFYTGGYGQYSPLFPNDSPEHMASNRRVEIIFRKSER